MPGDSTQSRHTPVVRLTHWLATICILALLFTGGEIIISHPRFYWGETGNPMTPSLFDIPIPASRPWVKTGYNYVLPDQNGWSRNLHFQAAWILLFTGLVYVAWSLRARHFRFTAYNPRQRITYLALIFVLTPIAIWTGLAMSPGLVSAFPFLVTSVGGHQSARTIHFFASISFIAFLFIHLAMVWRAGFLARTRPMLTDYK